MEKIKIAAKTFIYPMPVTLLGSTFQGKANFMALGWLTRVNANPPKLAAGVLKSHATAPAIQEAKTFSINFPSAEMIAVTDYCGIVSGKNVDKSGLFDVFYGDLKTAPMIKACPLCLECQLTDTLEFESDMLFVGEIAAAYCGADYLTDGKPDVKKLNPLVLTMPDNSYWTIGAYAGKAWGIGKDFKKA